MVRWLSPRVLIEAGLRVVISSLFGQYADKREFQAALDPQPGPPLAYKAVDEEEGRLWLDFVADLGDGFDSTYAIASLLGRARLGLAAGGGHPDLPRGRALVMGGDQVYPTATRQDYENRFRGPYSAALPWTAGRRPDLLAIPGNHDWYDGLTNFLRFFCAGRDVGAWRTRQRRSYFALALPHDWWLLAIDIQLDTFIDEPQLEYFRGIGLGDGDRVILVTGKPSWTKVRPGHEPDSYKNLSYFTEHGIAPAGAAVAVTLTGDLHHYARYEADDGTQLITAGGGGAYLFPTHELEPTLELPDHEQPYRLAACFPSARESKRMVWGAWRLSSLAPGLAVVLALTYALVGASLFAALVAGPGFFAAVAALGVAVLAALVVYSAAQGPLARFLLGAAHAAVHLALAAAPALIADVGLGADGAFAGLLVAAACAATGMTLGASVFGLYLVISHPFAPKHVNDVLACQGIPDYKNFLRLALDERGLTIYPIGIRRVPRAWAAAPRDGDEAPWLAPADGELRAELIEPPIEVPAGTGQGGRRFGGRPAGGVAPPPGTAVKEGANVR
ncbi:hypothetical protein BH20ACT19_BH20ACT19_12040 [soil metagenome]